jgi:hypothetical protein
MSMVKKKMPPHIVLPNGMWRFVKRGARTTLKRRNRSLKRRNRRNVIMAPPFTKGGARTTLKRRNRRNVIMARRGRRYSRARRYYSRARGGRGKGGGGVTKNILDGVIVGIAQTALPDVLPMQDALICTGVGWFRRNPTLITLGGVQLGAYVGGMIGGGLGMNKVGGVSQV